MRASEASSKMLRRLTRPILPVLGLSVLNIDPDKDQLLINLRQEDEDEVQRYAFFQHGMTYLQWTKEEIIRNFWYNRYYSSNSIQKEQKELSHKYWNEWFGNKIYSQRLKQPKKMELIANELTESMDAYIENAKPFHIENMTDSWWKIQEILNLATSNIFPVLFATKIVGKLMENRDDINILDIGCGTGIFGAFITQYIKDQNITINIMGIDASEYVINTINDKYKFLDDYYDAVLNFNICHPDFENLEINHKFDVVLSLELLFESSSNGYPGIKAIKDCMEFIKDDGYFVSVNGINKTDFVNYAIFDDLLQDFLDENNIEMIRDEVIVYDKEVNKDSIYEILDKSVNVRNVDLSEYDIPYQVVVVRIYHKRSN